jgi:membrane protein YdbS with pleckstrin-like domain
METINLRPAAIYAIARVSMLIFIAICLAALAWLFVPAFIFLSILAMVIALYRFLLIRHTKYELTPELLHIKTGLLLKRTDSLEFYRIKDYIITQNPFMQLTLISTDPENKQVTLTGIPHSDLPDTIRELVQQARQRNKIVELN